MITEMYVMWKRQVIQFWRSKPRLIGSFGQPLLFLLAIGLGFGPIFEKAGGGNYILFLVPGIIGMTILFGSMFIGMSMIWDKEFGFLKEVLVAPVSRTSVLIGRCLGGATTSTLRAVIVLFLSYFMGFQIKNLLLFPVAIVFMFLISLLFTLVGTIIGSKLDDMQSFPLIMNFLMMPIFFLSGALFPLNNLPGALQLITELNPLSYGVDGLRYLLVGTTVYGIYFDTLITVGVTLCLIGIGSYFFKRMEV